MRGKPTEATSVAALLAQDRFRQAVRDCKQAIEMAYSHETDETRWASEVQRWAIRRRNAQFYARRCKIERLPSSLLTEVIHQLRSLDDEWKIACEHRAASAPGKRLKVPTPTRKRGPKAKKFEAIKTSMRNDLRQGKRTKLELQTMREKELAAIYHASRDTVRRARNALLSELVDNSNSDK
jgi:hypothetical protein